MEPEQVTPGMTPMATEEQDTPEAARLRQELVGKLMDMQREGKLAPAIDHWKEILAAPDAPPHLAAHVRKVTVMLNNCGISLYSNGQIEDALVCFMLAMRVNDKCAPALNNAATCLRDLGRLEDSTAIYREALRLNPTPGVHSNLLFNLHYDPRITPADIATAHREWDARHGAGVVTAPASYANAPDPERRIRVGLVSADFGRHPVGILLVQYLEHADPAQTEFICYATAKRQGAITDRIRKVVVWQDVAGVKPEPLAEKILADQIDILIDMSGHAAENRLTAFARKPAPIQIMWNGYPGENGLAAMDYVLGDPYVLPDALQKDTRAKFLRLPHSFICLDPPDNAPPPGPLPATVPGAITFGCVNNPVKINTEVVALWAKILKRLPQSKLMFKYKGFAAPTTRQRYEQMFRTNGVAASQLLFEGESPLPEMFGAMNRIDLALDPFPFCGGMMSLYTMWMSIPILTWPRDIFASRQTMGFFTTIGITDTIASSAEDYVEKAVALAHDLPRLADLRRRIRPALEVSPLCDGPQAAADLQKLLRQVWRDWCAKAKKSA